MEMERKSSFPAHWLRPCTIVSLSPVLVHVFVCSYSWCHFYIITTNILLSLDLQEWTIAHLILGQVEHALVDAVLTRIGLLRPSKGECQL